MITTIGWVTDLGLPSHLLERSEAAGGPGALLPDPDRLSSLAGEFLLVESDERSGAWWAARDPAGVQPAYWAHGPDGVVIDTSPGAVVHSAGLTATPDLDFLAQLLASGPPAGVATPLEGLHRLPPGHAMRVTPGDPDPVIWRWWSPPPPGTAPSPTVDELRDTYRTVIADRIAAAGPDARIAVELSGGLDSTLVAALAREVLPGDRLVALTVTHDDAGSTDLPFARLAAEALDIELVVVPWAPRTPDEILAECEGGARLPDPTNGFGFVYRVARDLRADVLLGGSGGDQWMEGLGSTALDLLATGHPATAHRDVERLIDPALWRLPAGRTLRAGARWARHTPPADRARVACLRRQAPWLTTEAIERSRLGTARSPLPRPPRGGRATQERWTLLDDGWEQWALESYAHPANAAGIGWGVPFWNRQAVEAALAVPERARWRRRDSRWLSRQLLPAAVPDAIRHRPDKGDFTALAAREAMWAPLGATSTWRATALGLVDPGPAQACLDAVRDGHGDVWASWRLTAAEWVLRAGEPTP